MFQLPIPNKRITWFFSIFFTILFLFVYYRFDSLGYGMYENSINKFYYICDGNIYEVLKYQAIIPLYKNFEGSNFVYFQVKNISGKVIKKLKIDVPYKEYHFSNLDNDEKEENVSKLLYYELLKSNNDETIDKNVIYDLQSGSKTILKNYYFGQSFFEFSFHFEFRDEDFNFSSKDFCKIQGIRNKNNTIKMTLIPFLLLSPFSTAIFPVAILFLGYLFEAMLLDRKYEFDELRFLIRNISNSIFYFLHKIKVKVRKIRKKAISVDEDKKKKEWIIDKEVQIIWQFIGLYFFSIVILYTLFSWYIVSFEYLSPLLIVLSVVGIFLIIKILYSHYKKNQF